MFNIDQAREWAEKYKDIYHFTEPGKSVIDLILSLPDQWVDVKKVQEVINSQLSVYTPGTVDHDIAEEITRKLESLLTPKLPTLADMTQEERKACKWMQCKVEGSDGLAIIIGTPEYWTVLLGKSGETFFSNNDKVTPLPDLPKLEWPGGVVDCEIVEEPETVDAPPAEKVTLPKPEDVPANELWLVEHNGLEFVAKRNRGHSVDYPWRIASADGEGIDIAGDSQITLIHKLVPEPPALPEGMRLADHAEYGRVVVAPRANTHREESFYRLRGDNPWGASHGYLPTEEFTFLDGNQ